MHLQRAAGDEQRGAGRMAEGCSLEIGRESHGVGSFEFNRFSRIQMHQLAIGCRHNGRTRRQWGATREPRSGARGRQGRWPRAAAELVPKKSSLHVDVCSSRRGERSADVTVGDCGGAVGIAAADRLQCVRCGSLPLNGDGQLREEMRERDSCSSSAIGLPEIAATAQRRTTQQSTAHRLRHDTRTETKVK